MESIRNNKFNIIATFLYIILFSLTLKDSLSLIYFTVILVAEIYFLSKKQYDKVLMQSFLFIPLIGIMKMDGIPIFNIYNAIFAVYLSCFCKEIKMKPRILCVYVFVVLFEIVRVLLINESSFSLYDYLSIPFLLLSILNYIYIHIIINSYYSLKNYSIQFVIGTIFSMIYGFIRRFIIGGLQFALINNSIATRNAAAAGDSNYYGLYILISVSFLIAFCSIEKKNYLPTFGLSFLMLFMGLTSTSRMYYIMLIIVFTAMILIMLRGYFSKRILLFIMMTLAIIALFLTFNNMIIDNFNFLLSRFQENDVSNGRFSIIDMYMEIMRSNLFYELFGVGIVKYPMRIGAPIYAHNLYLELFICNGIFGCLVLFFAISMYIIRNFKNNKIIAYLPLGIIIASGLALNYIEVDCFYLLFGLIFSFLRINTRKIEGDVNG